MDCCKRNVLFALFLAFTFISCAADTDSRDVEAMNSLFASLNHPPLRGWVVAGGDPCGDQWQGVSCVSSKITALDLSGNNLTGRLPPAMANLLSVTSLHLQNNKLVGTLYVLQDLQLIDLNIENNLFSGAIPAKLLNIPNFRKEGNPFNTIVFPPPPLALPPAAAYSTTSADVVVQQTNRHASETPDSEISKESLTNKRNLLITALAVAVLVLLGLFIMLTCCKRKLVMGASVFPYYEKSTFKSPTQWNNKEGKGSFDMGEHKIDMSDVDTKFMASQRPPLPHLPGHVKITLNPILPLQTSAGGHSVKSLNSSSSVKVFTIATLRQYTNSFSKENLLGECTLGCAYKAELPNGEVLAVKRLNRKVPRQQSDEEFLQLIPSLSRICHDNVSGLVGYCNEQSEQLLIYEYCNGGTLYDALFVDENILKKLSWDMRIQIALGAARALQYLHEDCQPLIVHQNFNSANILLDNMLVARVLDCGLGYLISAISASQIDAAKGYAAPEFGYTCKSDVYSFGVVMLELLTGRKAYDSLRYHGEQSLVRWASPRLHNTNALVKMVDPALHGAFCVKSLSFFADIISRCIQWEPEFRPPMSEIIQELLQIQMRRLADYTKVRAV